MSDEPTVSRKVYFFRIEHFSLVSDLLPLCLAEIANLPFDDQGRYQQDISDNVRLSVYPDRIDYPLRLRFGRTRKKMLPDIENAGNLQTLELAEDAGLIDVCHIVIFPDGHVAAEFNHDGPRIRKLGEYLYFKGKNLPSAPTFLPLFERNIVEVLSDLESIRVIEIDVPPDTAALVRMADLNIAAAIEASERAGSSERVGLTLTSSIAGGIKLRDIARRFAELIQKSPTDRERFNTLKATGYHHGSSIRHYVDLLEQQLVSGELFYRNTARSRSINTEKAYDLIERAYTIKQHRLSTAASATDPW